MMGLCSMCGMMHDLSSGACPNFPSLSQAHSIPYEPLNNDKLDRIILLLERIESNLDNIRLKIRAGV